MGSTSAASLEYAWAVAAANAVNNSYDDVEAFIIESGAGLDNLSRIREGTSDFALAVDVPSTYLLVVSLLFDRVIARGERAQATAIPVRASISQAGQVRVT